MVCDNITQIAYLISKILKIDMIVFVGGFVFENPCVWTLMSKSLKYWSKGKLSPYFFEHDGYLGAIGALLADQPAEMWSKTPVATPVVPHLPTPGIPE